MNVTSRQFDTCLKMVDRNAVLERGAWVGCKPPIPNHDVCMCYMVQSNGFVPHGDLIFYVELPIDVLRAFFNTTPDAVVTLAIHTLEQLCWLWDQQFSTETPTGETPTNKQGDM